jgi:glycosyltransferase involved in cell wall biosynthesis
MRLSAAIVCRNSAATIGRTLESMRGLVDEIVAVDSGSTDTTLMLLDKHRAKVIKTEWRGFGPTKQQALDACTGDWVLCIDSDESVEPELAASVRAAIQTASPAVNGFLINRRMVYRGRPLHYTWQPEHRLFLVRRGRARWTGPEPHAELVLDPGSPSPTLLTGDLRHDAIGTFADFLAKQVGYSKSMAQSLHIRGQRGSLLKLVTSPPGAFFKQLILKQAWRDGWPGWLAAASTAAATLMKHILLIELSRRDRP